MVRQGKNTRRVAPHYQHAEKCIKVPVKVSLLIDIIIIQGSVRSKAI